MNTDKLKPCPFCDSLDLTYFGSSIRTAHKVQCLECYATVASTTQEAATVWNRRPNEILIGEYPYQKTDAYLDHVKQIAELTKQRDELLKAVTYVKSEIKADGIEEAIKETRESMEEGSPKWFCRVEDLRKYADKLRG